MASKKIFRKQKRPQKKPLVISSKRVESSFLEVVRMITNAKQQAFHAVNTALIDLYWEVGS